MRYSNCEIHELFLVLFLSLFPLVPFFFFFQVQFVVLSIYLFKLRPSLLLEGLFKFISRVGI